MSGLLNGTTCVIHDATLVAAGSVLIDLTLWRFAAASAYFPRRARPSMPTASRPAPAQCGDSFAHPRALGTNWLAAVARGAAVSTATAPQRRHAESANTPRRETP